MQSNIYKTKLFCPSLKCLFLSESYFILIQVNNEVISRLCELGSESAAVVNQTAISSLAEFTAAAMECFHKSAELLLAKQIRNTPEEAENYVQ